MVFIWHIYFQIQYTKFVQNLLLLSSQKEKNVKKYCFKKDTINWDTCLHVYKNTLVSVQNVLFGFNAFEIARLKTYKWNDMNVAKSNSYMRLIS